MTTPALSIHQFRYQRGKMRAGTVFHYIKSNIDGSYPARVFIRIMDKENLDVWKFEAHNADAAHVTAHMNWDTFSADAIESWVVTPDGKSRPQASLTSSGTDALFHIRLGDKSDSLRIGHYPVHVYNFDFISLNVSLRHWTKPEGEVTLGVVQPNFDPEPDALLKFEGTVLLRYVGNEERQNQDCRKYEIDGEGLHGQKGILWVNRLLKHIEDMEIPIADNPDWDDFKFRLVSMDEMDEQVWQEFLTGEIRKLNR